MRTKTTSKILSETSEETKEKVRNNANNLINKKMDTKTKMTTQEKAEELVDNLGISHAIYVTEEVIAILEDWEGTELAQKDWIEIQEIVSSIPLPSNVDKDISWESENDDFTIRFTEWKDNNCCKIMNSEDLFYIINNEIHDDAYTIKELLEIYKQEK